MWELVKCRGEFNLMVLYDNFKWVLKEIGVEASAADCRHWKEVQKIGM